MITSFMRRRWNKGLVDVLNRPWARMPKKPPRRTQQLIVEPLESRFMLDGSVATTTTVTSSANPSVFGQTVTFTAKVTSNYYPPSGNELRNGPFIIRDGITTLGTANFYDYSGFSNTASFTLQTAGLSAGRHTITAVYDGNDFYARSTSDALAQVVNLGNTTTTLTSSANPSGQSVTFTIKVQPVSPSIGVPTGMATVRDGTTTLGTATLNASSQAT